MGVTRAGAGDGRHWSWWVAVLGGGAFLLFGIWALAAPRSFFDQLATFEPYNVHFLHDIGAFQIGLGAVLVLAAVTEDALTAALLGTGVGAVVHVLAHVIDVDRGGTPASDIPTFAALALVLLVAGLSRRRSQA